MLKRHARIGFVSTRLAGTDGVSLETAKWSSILTALGHECFYFAGESEWPEERTKEAHFTHPDIVRLNEDLFNDYRRAPETSKRVADLKHYLKDHLHGFTDAFELDLLIVENALSLPMNVPLGLALTEFAAETCMPTIGHHHDFYWERKRFVVNAASDYLRAAFPPTLHSVRHVVINSFAGGQLALRTGASSTLIPNVMDFNTPPPPPDDYTAGLRADLGLEEGEFFILQPTRIVPRKRIERAIELVRRLGMPAALVISHASGDEGHAYAEYLREYADLMGVRLIFAANIVNHTRGQTPEGRPVYSLADVYQMADLVTYPSTVEGFGNAFLETIYYRRPIVISTYEIFKTDIQPKGFKVIGFDDFITEDTVAQAKAVLQNPDLATEITAHNYEVGRRYYSYRTLQRRLGSLLSAYLGD